MYKYVAGAELELKMLYNMCIYYININNINCSTSVPTKRIYE